MADRNGAASSAKSVALTPAGADHGRAVHEAGEHRVHAGQDRQVVQRGQTGVGAEPGGSRPTGPAPSVLLEHRLAAAVEDGGPGPPDHLGHGHDPAVEVGDAVGRSPGASSRDWAGVVVVRFTRARPASSARRGRAPRAPRRGRAGRRPPAGRRSRPRRPSDATVAPARRPAPLARPGDRFHTVVAWPASSSAAASALPIAPSPSTVTGVVSSWVISLAFRRRFVTASCEAHARSGKYPLFCSVLTCT